MGQRILIVDDDTYIRDLYQEVLASEGFEVVAAKDGEEGLKNLLEGGFDVILLDIMMPRLDGIGVLTTLKETQPAKPNGPIIILSNLDHDPVLDQAASLGVTRHLLKADMLPPALIAAVREAIASAH